MLIVLSLKEGDGQFFPSLSDLTNSVKLVYSLAEGQVEQKSQNIIVTFWIFELLTSGLIFQAPAHKSLAAAHLFYNKLIDLFTFS